MNKKIKFRVNGKDMRSEVPTNRLLIDCLRYDLGLTGTKEGCSVGVCGACTVLMDGDMISSCLTLAVMADGHDITTVEGLAKNGELNPVQKSFIQYGGFQCGICTPGQVVAATALLKENPKPNEDEIKDWMMGNLCRCTGYYKIIESIQKAHQFATNKDTAMIPFEYRTPKNLKEVHATLKEFGTDAKLIAGGTALVIMMKQRLVRPTCLVSLRSVRGLNGIEVKDGGLSIGGLATHRSSGELVPGAPALTDARRNLSPRGHPARAQHGHRRRRPGPRRPQPGSAAEPDRPRRHRQSHLVNWQPNDLPR